MKEDLESKLKNIKLLAMDFDGIMTDGCVYVNQDGQETVKCSRKDGLGIELLKKHGLDAVVISKEVNPVVGMRCNKLKIECTQAVADSEAKSEILKRVAKERNLKLEEVAYMGDDLNDLKMFDVAGLAITVADGHPLIKQKADLITKAKGGQNAVREVCEIILEAKGVKLEF